MFTTGCALVWRDSKGKKKPQIFTKVRWCLVLPVVHRDCFIIKGTYISE